MQSIINSLIRPFRFTYAVIDLGTRRSPNYIRQDELIENQRGLQIHYSYYKCTTQSNVCAIYAHCNTGSRIQACQYMQEFCKNGWNSCSFDFTGSGISEGQYISLGHYQAADLECIVSLIRSKGNKQLLLWGRSMGAASIILYLSQTKQRDYISGAVLDSPYCSLWSLIKQLGSNKTGLPQFIIQQFLEYVRRQINHIHHFDLKKLQPLQHVKKLTTALLYITSEKDQFIKAKEVKQLFKATNSSQKYIEYIDKQHNCLRDHKTIERGIQFLQNCLKKLNKNILKYNYNIKNNNNNNNNNNNISRQLTGYNMADMILKVQKQKKMKKMKSYIYFKNIKKQNNTSLSNVLKTQPQQLQQFNFKLHKKRKIKQPMINLTHYHINYMNKNKIGLHLNIK